MRYGTVYCHEMKHGGPGRCKMHMFSPPQTRTHFLSSITPMHSPDQKLVTEAIRSLRIYFLGALERKELVVGNSTAPQASSDDATSKAVAVFRQWMSKQYTTFTNKLLATLKSSGSAAIQVQIPLLKFLTDFIFSLLSRNHMPYTLTPAPTRRLGFLRELPNGPPALREPRPPQ